MGFGWLFIGYFVTMLMTFNPVGFAIRLIGYAMILVSAIKLRRYQSAFGWAALGSCLMLGVSAALAVSDVSEYLYQGMVLDTKLVSDLAREILGHVERGAQLVFTVLLLWAIRKIALETEVRKISDNAIRNLIFVGFYYVVYVIGNLPFAWVKNLLTELGVISLMLYFAWIILNLCLIYSCYANICDEGDVEMERKPSRFAFVNQFREENDARHRKAMEDGEAFRRARMERRQKRRNK